MSLQIKKFKQRCYRIRIESDPGKSLRTKTMHFPSKTRAECSTAGSMLLYRWAVLHVEPGSTALAQPIPLQGTSVPIG